jgi:XRE family transcriptional regulator, regulator of sulfur utilization
MNIGESIRHARLKKGLSQESMADSLHISTSAYGDIERNKSEVTVKRLLKISQILEVNIDEMINNNLAETKTNEEILRLKAELMLAKIESLRWKERFMRSVFADNNFKNPDRQKIGFK